MKWTHFLKYTTYQDRTKKGEKKKKKTHTENLKSPILLNKFISKNLPTNKTSGLDDFTSEFYYTLKEEVMQI